MTTSKPNKIAASVAIATLIGATMISVFGAAQSPEPTWLTAGMPNEHGGPAPLGELTPDPPEVPQQTANQLAPPVAAPPPKAQQPQSPPRQEAPPQQQAPAQGPGSAGGPPPAPAPPPSPPPPRGHVQLAP